MKAFRLNFFVGGLIALAASTSAGWWLHYELTVPYLAPAAAELFVEIPRGAGTSEIATVLTRAGVLRHRLPFIAYLRWIGAGRHLQAGEYRFEVPATPVEVARRLLRGDVFFQSITIPEGLTSAETIELISEAGLADQEELDRAARNVSWIRDIAPGARSLEGYLFPDTYRFPRRSRPEEIVRTLVDRFREKVRPLLASAPPGHGWTLEQIVTLASIIEKEVRAEQERSLVASVLVNRLSAHIPLACDATIVYAMKLAGRWDGNIRKADLGLDSPYNTYTRQGLPPGPIANPGVPSLRAALAPDRTEFLYYVSRNDGTHVFSRDYRSHAAAVAKYQKRLR
jgi:UPF0755 protein